MTRAALRTLALAAVLASGRGAAQTNPPRDTLVIGADSAVLADTMIAASDSAAPRRPSRWAAPFAVESSGQAVPRRVRGEVTWFHPDSVPRQSEPDSTALALADTTSADSAPPSRAPARTPRRTARADTARADSAPAARTRRTARADTSAGDTARRPARARTDTAATRIARRDSAARTGSATRPRTHTVAAGETLFGIARRYDVTTAQLRALNPGIDSQDLDVGTVLRLPARARAPAAPAEDRTPPTAVRPRPTPRPGTRRTHTVVRGETLYGLARRFHVAPQDIQRANHMESDQVRVGQTLIIP